MTEAIFEGLRLAVTGVLEGVDRDDVIDFIKDKEGKAAMQVSRQTNYLIAGPKLEDGRDSTESKQYEDAIRHGTIIWSQAQFEEFIQTKCGFAERFSFSVRP
ncbi:BRCT domain-containing protein [Enterococcus rotai]|uniref:BRCT domain-containing protein n=1 Tax=Enterococcus rotai TaxID=118060 RepID=UPI0035C68C8F